MTLTGKQINDLLEADGQKRSMKDDELYILTRDGRFILKSEFTKELKEEIDSIYPSDIDIKE